MKKYFWLIFLIPGLASCVSTDENSGPAFKPFHRDHPEGFDSEEAKTIAPDNMPREVAARRLCDPVKIKEGLDIEAEIDDMKDKELEKKPRRKRDDGSKPFSASFECGKDF